MNAKEKVATTETTEVTNGTNVEQKLNHNASFTGDVKRKPFKKEGFKEAAMKYPAHILNLAYIVKSNSEIRRFTALGILNYLLQKGEIKGTKKYVRFLETKFQVICDGLTREYNYKEKFFLNALVSSFTSFASSAQYTIATFVEIELGTSLGEVVTNEEADNLSNAVLAEEDVKVNEENK
jgi:hypothetical protein